MRPAGDEDGPGDEVFGWRHRKDLFPRSGREGEGISFLCAEFQEIEGVDETASRLVGVCGRIFVVEFFALRNRSSARYKDPH